ncbi:DNA-binding protein [Paenibacillus sp. 481]|nr:DNA-binding protein [Paenibacillus sp. 481]
MVLILIGVSIWVYYGVRQYFKEPEPMENVYLSDRFPQDDDVIAMIEQAGYEIIGGKYFVPLSFSVDHHGAEANRLWIDMIVRREGSWYPVRIIRERMHIEWSASGMRKHWSAYFAIYPDCDGIIIVDMVEQRLRVVRMEWGDPQT